MSDSKVCGVCGDKALGNNFNAITCESCKAFFRRNALKQKEFVCPFNGNCKVDAITRRFCQKCRLKKCFEIGMKKEWIMTDEEKKLKKRKIELNRVKRQSSDISIDTPPAKTPCLTDQNTEELTPHSNLQPDHSHSDPLQQPGKHEMMTQIESGVDSTTYDPVKPEDEMAVVQISSSNIDNSPCSSNSSSDVNVAYTAPASGMMTPLHMSQIEAAQLLNKSTSQNSTMGSNQIDMESHNAMHVITVQRTTHEPQSFHFPSDTYNYTPGHYSAVPFYQEDENNSQIKSVQHSLHCGNQGKPSTQSYQMPLLSSLMRPQEPESPPDESSFGIHLVQKDDYGTSYNEQIQQSPVSLEQQQFTPGGARSSPSQPHYYNSCHSGNSCCRQEIEEDVPPPLPLNTMDSILSVAIRAEFNSFGMMSKSCDSKALNPAELAKLQELLIACKALNDPVDQEGPIKLSKNSDPTLINVINLTDIAIRRLIKMSKKISGFKNMCQEDQIALLKGGCTEMMILRSVVTYDPDRDSWNIPHSYGYNIKLGVLKEAPGNLYEEHQRFVKSFKPEWRSNESIMILLCAITLFTAERPNVIHKDVVKLEQDSYYYLLKRYLESIVNGCEARSIYLLLIRKIAELRILNSNHLRVFLEVNPREVLPLLREVFSMV